MNADELTNTQVHIIKVQQHTDIRKIGDVKIMKQFHTNWTNGWV